jgi:hypothetical protein
MRLTSKLGAVLVIVVGSLLTACVDDTCACSRPGDISQDDIRLHPEGPAQKRPEMHNIR